MNDNDSKRVQANANQQNPAETKPADQTPSQNAPAVEQPAKTGAPSSDDDKPGQTAPSSDR